MRQSDFNSQRRIVSNRASTAVAVKKLNKSEPALKSVVKVQRNRRQITLIAKFTEPSDSQLAAIGQALFSLINK